MVRQQGQSQDRNRFDEHEADFKRFDCHVILLVTTKGSGYGPFRPGMLNLHLVTNHQMGLTICMVVGRRAGE